MGFLSSFFLSFPVVIQTPEGRRGMLRLAHDMMRRFCSTIGASTSNSWLGLSGAAAAADDSDVRIMMRDDPSGDGLLLCAATSTWLPVPRALVFDFLRHEHSRAEVSSISRRTLASFRKCILK
jgi:homeobox-leucine zipper protein